MPQYSDAVITNTPGIYYAIAYWLSCMLYISVNKKKMSGGKLRGTQVLFFALIVSFMTVTDGINKVFFIPTMSAVVFLMFLFMKTTCKMSNLKAGYFVVRAFILGEFAASLAWQLYYFGMHNLGFPRVVPFALLFLGVIYALIFSLMYVFEKKYREENEQLEITGKEFLPALMLCVIIFAISNLSYVFANTPFSSQFPTEIFIIRTTVDLGGLGILFAYHMQLQDLKVKMEMEHLQSMLYLQYENYQNSEKSIALVNQKYHDLKHQLNILRLESLADSRTEYIEQIEQEIKSYEAQNKTGNKVLDTILTAKTLECQEDNITLTCVAEGKELEFMSSMDLSALFGNALDNAIESVKKVKDMEKRLIHVSVARQKGFLHICVENYYEGELKFEKGFPKTTKSDKQYHGFGIRSIQMTVEKYQGSLSILAKDNWFELRILFPLDFSSS